MKVAIRTTAPSFSPVELTSSGGTVSLTADEARQVFIESDVDAAFFRFGKSLNKAFLGRRPEGMPEAAVHKLSRRYDGGRGAAVKFQPGDSPITVVRFNSAGDRAEEINFTLRVAP